MDDTEIEAIAKARWRHIIQSTPNTSRKIVEWDDVPDDAKETIRNSVASDLDALELAGYRVSKTKEPAQ